MFICFDLIVKDYGYGIPKENQKDLFVNFGKLKDTRGVNKSGLGLGLSICRDMIQQMGGSVKVKSKVDVGTEFIISLKAQCRIQ